MKLLLASLLFISVSLQSLAQDDRIDPERPSETQTASTVGKNKLQLEAGSKIEKLSADLHRTAQPELLLRYGIFEKIELRARAEVYRYSAKAGEGHEVTTGLQPVAFGLKASLLEGKKWIPKTALIASVTVPGFSSEKFKTDHAAPRVRLTFENDITQKIQLAYNIAAEWDGTESQPEWVYTVSPGVDLSPACQLFVEAFGRVRNNEAPETTFDGGFLFFVNKDFTLDLSSGVGISKSAPEYFVSVGGAIRF